MTHDASPATPAEVLGFWFGELTPENWFRGGPAIDALVRERHLGTYEYVARVLPHGWFADPDGLLAAILVLDQFPRNLFRGNPRSFESDRIALTLAKLAVARGEHEAYDTVRRKFLLMPFQHSEVIEDQELAVRLFADIGDADALKFAEMHRDIVRRFGRFPHRNAVLGRVSTPEEKALLAGPALFW
ncbi:MAG: DUF924 family protein [Rhizobiales bacterium]|nr:DUF924 family protein [Hyphomicrobiales bacterium]